MQRVVGITLLVVVLNLWFLFCAVAMGGMDHWLWEQLCTAFMIGGIIGIGYIFTKIIPEKHR